MKVWALVVGPSGLGEYGVLQSLVGAGVLVGGLGLSTSVVRFGAEAIALEDGTKAAVTMWSATLASWVAGVVTGVAFWMLRDPIAEYVLDGTPSWIVGLMGVAVAFSIAAAADTGVINAYHRIGTLSKMSVVGTLVGGGVAVAILLSLGRPGVPWAVASGGVVGWVVSYAYRLREGFQRVEQRWGRETCEATLTLLRHGLPFTAASVVGTGATLLLPFIVLHELGVDEVGQYRAAMGISVGYVGFLLTALAMDYYPRLSGLRTSAQLATTVNQQLSLLLLAGGSVILFAQATATLVVPLLYSSAFTPSVAVLEWQLVGTIFRFWSYGFAFVVLARGTSLAYLIVEAIGGGALLLGTWGGVRALGLVGTGIGFLTAYAVYGFIVWAYVRKTTGVKIESYNILIMLALTLMSLSIQGIGFLVDGWIRIGIGIAIGLVFSTHAINKLYANYRSDNISDDDPVADGLVGHGPVNGTTHL